MVNKKFINVVNTFITNPKVECINVDHKQIILCVDDSIISQVLSYAHLNGFKKVFVSPSCQDRFSLIRF